MRIGGYEVLGEVGRGGMGVVYRVRTPDGREAALKLLLRTDAATFARFERERRLLASLGEEQGFVEFLDAGSSPGGAWLLMPFITGGTLRQRLERGPLGVEETIALGIQLASALGRAHERGIVHRDVKPENVLFSTPGRALLADLGLAKHFDRVAPGGSQSLSLTAGGTFKGTAGYVPPEQVEDARSAGPAADVFALGAVLYECLAGRPAFTGATVLDILARLSSGTVEPIARTGVPAWLERDLRRALAPDSSARFPDGASFARALRIGGAPARAARPARARSLLAGAAASVLLLGVFVLARGSGPAKRDLAPPVPLPPPELPARDAKVPRREVARLEAAVPPRDPAGARERVTLAREAFARGDSEAALGLTQEAVQLDPGDGRLWAMLSSLLYARKDFPATIVCATRALEQDASIVGAWRLRGAARRRSGDADGAISDLDEAIRLDPREAGALLERAQAFTTKGERARALADFEAGLSLLSPDDPQRAECERLIADLRGGEH